MNETHLMWFLQKVFTGNIFQSLSFHENGDVLVKFFDSGGNFHEQIWHADGTFATVNG